MKYFKVLHDFTGADAVELTVKKGDLVCAHERIEQDGWLKVEYASDTRRKGFVPLTYVREVANPALTSSLEAATGAAGFSYASPSVSFNTTPQPTSAAASATTAATSFTSAAVSLGEKMVQNSAVPPSPLQAAYAPAQPARQSAPPPQPSFSSRAGLQSSSFVPSSTFASSSDSALNTLNTSTFLQNPNAVVEAFMKNEVYFKQLMKQRQDALARLEGGLADAVADVAACKDKNAILARKLRDLDMTIEKERKKWRERVDEEKLLIQRAASSTTAASSSFVMTTSTTTTSNREAGTASSTLLNSIAHQRSLSQVSGRSSAAR